MCPKHSKTIFKRKHKRLPTVLWLAGFFFVNSLTYWRLKLIDTHKENCVVNWQISSERISKSWANLIYKPFFVGGQFERIPLLFTPLILGDPPRQLPQVTARFFGSFWTNSHIDSSMIFYSKNHQKWMQPSEFHSGHLFPRDPGSPSENGNGT